jgi:hypothetical protein
MVRDRDSIRMNSARRKVNAMPTSLDFHKATVLAFKHTLEGKSAKEKEKHVSIQIAEQFNGVVENVKKEYPDAAIHLPQPITWKGIGAQDMRIADIRFTDFEMLLNQVLAILDVLRDSR